MTDSSEVNIYEIELECIWEGKPQKVKVLYK